LSSGRIILGFGIALIVLLVLSTGITLVAQWKTFMRTPSNWVPFTWGIGVTTGYSGYGDYEEGGRMMKEVMGNGKCKCNCKLADFVNLTVIEGKVKTVNLTKGFIVVTSNGKDYNVFVRGVYVRISDGVLVFGGWILGNVKPNDLIIVKGIGRNSNVFAVEVTWKGNTYQIPAYYMYVLKSG